MNDEFLQDYCCINKYLLGPYIQVFTRKIGLLNTIKLDIVDKIISCIKEQFQSINSSQIASEKKPNKVHLSLPISGSTELLYDHIALTVRYHTSYLFFDDVLNSNYYQDYSSNDKKIPGKKSN